MICFSKTQKEPKKLEKLGSNWWVECNKKVCSQKTTRRTNQIESFECGEKTGLQSKQCGEAGLSSPEEAKY